MIEINKDPSKSDLRWFGLILAVVLGIVGAVIWLKTSFLFGMGASPTLGSKVIWAIALGFAAGSKDDTTVHTLTGTMDHSLTDNLTLKVEGRWDRFTQQSGPQGFFFVNGNRLDDRDQFPMLAQAIHLAR